MVRSSVAIVSLAAILAGCASAESTEASLEPVESHVDANASAITLATPTPIASLPMPNGNVVEFYEFSRGALLSERGAAHSDSTLDARGKDARDLTAIWTSLAPTMPVPKRLVDAQNRLGNLPAPPAKTSRTQVRRTGGAAARKPDASAAQADAFGLFPICNNGCCDYNWLMAQAFCGPADFDQQWFLFDYGYDYAIYDDIYIYRGLVCAAIGTSTYTVTIDGDQGGTWSVPEATYRTYYWVAGHSPFCLGPCGEDMVSGVNTYNTGAMHTYCGEVEFD